MVQQAHQGPPPPENDPVLAHLQSARDAYQAVRGAWEQQTTDLAETRARVAILTEQNKRLSHSIRQQHDEIKKERARVEHQRHRADQVTVALTEIHRALFGGNVHELILKTCLIITGATRGLYVTARGADIELRICAAQGVDGYPVSPPSDFIRALCGTVLEANDTVICNDRASFDRISSSIPAGERFHNCVAAQVALRRDFDGILIVADKSHGDFDHDDAQMLLSVGDQAAVAVENHRLKHSLQQAYVSTMAALADAVEAKDPYTHSHCKVVSRYARKIAERLHLPEEERTIVSFAALLHDVGKIGVSDGILNKPGPLIEEERSLVRAHVRVGHDLLQRVAALNEVADVILHHHEWYDGTGYPDGLKGEHIPIAARIVCAVDAYAAMTTRRSYKEAYTDEHARAELQRCAGTQFDPGVVTAMLAILDEPYNPQLEDEDDDMNGYGLLPAFHHVHSNIPDDVTP